MVREASPEASGVAATPKFQFEQVAKGQPRSVYVGFVESVENFYVQLSDGMALLDDLMEELQEHYDGGKGKPLRNPQVISPLLGCSLWFFVVVLYILFDEKL